MKRLLKYFLAALVVITGVFSQTADAKAFSYTYTVSFSAGGQGSINGGVQVRKASGNEASVSVSAKGDKILSQVLNMEMSSAVMHRAVWRLMKTASTM